MSSQTEFEQRTIDGTEDLLTAIYIQASRMYDVLFTLLTADHPELAQSLIKLHEDGVIVTPQPALRGDEN
jgi:hypothetical protein